MTRDALLETRSFRVKRWLARVGLSLAVGLIMFAAVSSLARLGARECLAAIGCPLILLWGGWGLQFLLFHRRNKL